LYVPLCWLTLFFISFFCCHTQYILYIGDTKKEEKFLSHIFTDSWRRRIWWLFVNFLFINSWQSQLDIVQICECTSECTNILTKNIELITVH
jgi:amino acid permease